MKSSRAEFSKATKEAAWKRCHFIEKQLDYWPHVAFKPGCEVCKQPLAGRQPEYDHHPIPAALDGPATLENCRVLCPPCHRQLTKSETTPMVSKAKRIEEKRAGLRRSKHKIQSRGF